MKVLKLVESKKENIYNKEYLIELKKVVRTKEVKSADPRAGRYTDNNYIETVAFVNGKSYMVCSYIELVITALKEGGYKFF